MWAFVRKDYRKYLVVDDYTYRCLVLSHKFCALWENYQERLIQMKDLMHLKGGVFSMKKKMKGSY